MRLIIDIPEGLKKDFELEQWTALSCMQMKDALMNGTPLQKGHGRLIECERLQEVFRRNIVGYAGFKQLFDNAPTIIEADKEG